MAHMYSVSFGCVRSSEGGRACHFFSHFEVFFFLNDARVRICSIAVM